MEYNDAIKDLLLQGKTAFEIEKYALEKGMSSLERDGIYKVIQWVITLDELYRLVKHK